MIDVGVKKIRNVTREIGAETSRMLWAVTAGICEFKGCNNRLFEHHVTGEHDNFSEKAHIYAFSQGGRRFNRLLPFKKINDFDNLMLLCPICHKLIDSSNHLYTAEELISMKTEHEERIRLLTNIAPDLKSYVIIYNARVGENIIKTNDYNANSAIIPELYPAENYPWRLSPNIKLYDNEDDFWSILSKDLDRNVETRIDELSDKHISLFAIAPQPLLFRLGTLINRNYDVDARQTQDDVSDWKWKNSEINIALSIEKVNASESSTEIALVVDFTCNLSNDEIFKTCGRIPIYRIKISKHDPKCIKSKQDQEYFLKHYREVLNEIRKEQDNDVRIHLFPIAPASISVQMGRHLMKGDPTIIIYDRNQKTGAFIKAISIEKSNHVEQGGIDNVSK
ncbi:MAG: hypothetical protein JM58_07170 [Peptococcaceae bacterium BICA1-8]|nr:MAG: hypothetical protein JM58_07170 [Peptococcaceae bacterium BICA1-8]